MANFKIGDIGRNIVINTNFNLSSNTDLEIQFTRTDQTTLTVNKAGGVTAPASNLTIDVAGVSTTFDANEYLLYPWKSGDLATGTEGTWTANGIYIEGVAKRFCGDAITFVVLKC